MTKILVTGSNGQLGNELRELANNAPFDFIFTDIAELDITDSNAVTALFAQEHFDFAINCAAYTNVNKAESDEELAKKINALAPENLAKACKTYQCKFIHISTDYVFDGSHCQPYSEDEDVCPQSAYGRTKLDGEQRVLAAHDMSIIIRTAWLYSTYGNNFVKTMIHYGKEKDSLNVVFDQVGTPTYAGDLAQAIITIITKVTQGEKAFVPGIYHFSNEGVCSWYDFTKEIHAIAGISCQVNPIETKDYPTPATRPFYSVLNKAKIKNTFGVTVPYWKDSLIRCIQKLKA